MSDKTKTDMENERRLEGAEAVDAVLQEMELQALRLEPESLAGYVGVHPKKVKGFSFCYI